MQVGFGEIKQSELLKKYDIVYICVHFFIQEKISFGAFGRNVYLHGIVGLRRVNLHGL
jgi:hypothetical protein